MHIIRFFRAPFTDVNKKASSQGDSMLVLDGLRGLAVLIVIASHTAAFRMSGQGSLGVLLFFFLSGFVLSIPYSNDPSRFQSWLEIRRFAVNRVLRIVPIYVVAVVVTSWIGSFGVIWILKHLIFLQGWNHLWSVAEEVRFYLVFPFVVLLLSLINSRLVWIVILSVLIVVAHHFKASHMIDMTKGRFVEFYLWFFIGGILVCFLWRHFKNSNSFYNLVIAKMLSLVSILILGFIFFSSDYMIAAFWRPLFPGISPNLKLNGWGSPELWFVLFFVLIFSVTINPGSKPGKFLQCYFLRHIGLLSYSLYLFHMLVFLQFQRFGFLKEGMFFAVFAVTYVIAYFSYILIEKPFLNFKLKPVRS